MKHRKEQKIDSWLFTDTSHVIKILFFPTLFASGLNYIQKKFDSQKKHQQKNWQRKKI